MMERKAGTKEEEAATQRVRLWFLFSLSLFSLFQPFTPFGFFHNDRPFKFTLDMSPHVKFMRY